MINVTPEFILLALVVITALAFDFTNGFHDTANAMATSIATKALSPKAAVTLSAILNLVGAFLSVEVAITVTNAVIRIQNADGTPKSELMADGGHGLLLILMAGLAGAIIWNILTWLWGLPSSSSHALFGGLVGATIAGMGWSGVKWVGEGAKLDGLVGKVVLPALFSPAIAILVAMVGTRLVFWITRGVAERYQESGFRWGQIGTASLLSLSHGTNDAQKTMGVITLALIARRLLELDDGDPGVGEGRLRRRYRLGHLHRWLANHPHDGQGPGRDLLPAGHGRGERVCSGHPHLEPARLRPVHHPRLHRLDHRLRTRPQGRDGALGRRRPNGPRLAHHPAAGRTGRRWRCGGSVT